MAQTAKILVIPGEIGDRKLYVVRKGEEPHEHPAVHISVSRQDSVHWISYSKKFVVRELRAIGKNAHKAPKHPFYRQFPEENCKPAFQTNSGPARRAAIGFTYEAYFDFVDGSQGDPHIQIGK